MGEWEMTFSDSDLKQLKEDLEIQERTMIVYEHEMRAILARLEAAEKVCEAYIERQPSGWVSDVLEAWRKVAGK